MCKFSHLSFGDRVNWVIKDCFHCKSIINYPTIAAYKGHVTIGEVYDLFDVPEFNCPSCGILCNGLVEPCDTGPDVDCEIFSRLEVGYES